MLSCPPATRASPHRSRPMPHQPPDPPPPDRTGPRPPRPPHGSTPMSIDPATLAAQLQWPHGFTCQGAVDCPPAAIGTTLALLETTRGAYHLLVTTDRYTRSRTLWVAWLPREIGLLTLIDEQPEGEVAQALVAIARHIADGQ